jgi:hypothetical protein
MDRQAGGITVAAAQADIRASEINGGVGVLVSGLVWLGAGAVAYLASFETALATLFFGGMAIYPVSTLLCRVLRAPAVARGNPMVPLALQSTVGLLAGFLLAWVIAQFEPAWFFPAMLVVIGARYFVFSTIYGSRTFIALGGVLTALGCAGLIALKLEPWMAAVAGGAVEVVFGVGLLATRQRT